MIPPWAAFLTVGAFVLLGIGLYLLAWHRGYLAGLHERVARLPGNPWRPPSESEFLSELLKSERLKPDTPKKYRREP